MNNEIEILYEDNDIIVCRKPAGLAVQSANVTAADMESLLKARLYRQQKASKDENSSQRNFEGRKTGSGAHKRQNASKEKTSDIYVIHRLDQPVEGIVIFAKNKKAAGILSKQAQADGGMNKTYLAALFGKLPDDKKEGELRDYLIKDTKTKCAKIVDKTMNGAKESILNYTTVREIDESNSLIERQTDKSQYITAEEAELNPAPITIVEIHLKTGRYHQIRAQFSHLGYPLLGDKRYGTQESNAVSESLGIKNVALCAYKLSLNHPSTEDFLEFEIIPDLYIMPNS